MADACEIKKSAVLTETVSVIGIVHRAFTVANQQYQTIVNILL
jgi:hemoglobin-like flavoprotein